MFKIEWDKETGGVKLSSVVTNDTINVSPRPVFFEELDLLGLDKLPNNAAWSYPHCKEPLLWCCNKQYFYFGELVFEVKGANIYDKPIVTLQSGKEALKLIPVNVKKMLEENKNEMFLLESEAIEFIRDTYDTYSKATKISTKYAANQLDFEKLKYHQEKKTKQKLAIVTEDCESFDIEPFDTAKENGKKVLHGTRIDKFIASFSGGKDSQVVLDLCTRALPPDFFEVYYSDTGYELPPSLTLYKDIENFYQHKYPQLKFHLTKNHESVLHYWDEIGTPSDTMRWCCSVMKTAPLYRTMKLKGSNKQAKILTFDGVRAEESVRRSGYARIGKGVKHNTVINASPILKWNSAEIYLYLFRHNLPINDAYRNGMTRVGCLICPFSSEWNDMISNVKYNAKLKPFLEKVEQSVEFSGIKDKENYIKQGYWKRRAGGRYMKSKTAMQVVASNPDLVLRCNYPKKDVFSYLYTVGEYTLSSDNKKGEIKYKNRVYFFEIENKKDAIIIRFRNTAREVVLQGLIKRAFYKSTFCINCEVCEVECPTGALSVYPTIKIDKAKCIHCHKCLLFHEKGCIVANSLSISMGQENNKKLNISKYNNFGLKREWLEDFFVERDNYWISSHGLNVKNQIPSLRAWLRDAEIIDSNNKITELGNFLADTITNDEQLIWEVVWINLTYNSFIVKWYANNVIVGTRYTAKILEDLILEQYPEYKQKTVQNAIYQVRRTLYESPIGDELGQYKMIDKEQFVRQGFDEISPVAMAYSLYKYSQEHKVTMLRASDFYATTATGGIHKEFGTSRGNFEKGLRALNSSEDRILVAELNMGLDSITLRNDLTPLEILKKLA